MRPTASGARQAPARCPPGARQVPSRCPPGASVDRFRGSPAWSSRPHAHAPVRRAAWTHLCLWVQNASARAWVRRGAGCGRCLMVMGDRGQPHPLVRAIICATRSPSHPHSFARGTLALKTERHVRFPSLCAMHGGCGWRGAHALWRRWRRCRRQRRGANQRAARRAATVWHSASAKPPSNAARSPFTANGSV